MNIILRSKSLELRHLKRANRVSLKINGVEHSVHFRVDKEIVAGEVWPSSSGTGFWVEQIFDSAQDKWDAINNIRGEK